MQNVFLKTFTFSIVFTSKKRIVRINLPPPTKYKGKNTKLKVRLNMTVVVQNYIVLIDSDPHYVLGCTAEFSQGWEGWEGHNLKAN